MAAPYSPRDLAKWILANIDRDAGDSITHLKLQKLLYYAQAWSLALFGKALFDEEIKAWAHGPVVETVFYAYRENGWSALPPPEDVPSLGREDENHLKEILSIYGDLSAKHLERMTHTEDPWKNARGDLPPEARSNAIISKESMAKYYKRLYDEIGSGKE